MLIKLSLNSNNPNVFMWFLENATVHLTDENPGPVEIDFEGLNKDSQKAVVMGIRTGHVICSEPVEKLYNLYMGQPITIPPPVIKPQVIDTSNMEKLLKKSVSAIKKYAGLSIDIRDLRLMLELEKANKNREEIVSSVEKRINLLSATVEKSILAYEDKRAPITTAPDKLADKLEIIESDFKTVNIEV